MQLKIISYLLIILLFVSGCSTVAAADDDLSIRQIRVVTTTGMVTDLVENVGGDRVDVTGLMGPGIDPHLYKATEGNVVSLANADVVFYNGLHLEAQLGEVFERMGDRLTAVAVTDAIDRSLLLSPPEFEGAYDPHVWFDVSLWMNAIGTVQDALVQLDPQHAQVYEANAEAYLAELQNLHEYVQEQAKKVPERQRVLITAHDAFNYFGRAYGFEVRGLQGISTATEASTADVQALAVFIAERQIPAVFIESSVPTRTIEAVQAAVRARGFEVAIGGELFSDALGNPGTLEGAYIGMVKHNIDTIVDGLVGEGE